jgi:hypothetical protein
LEEATFTLADGSDVFSPEAYSPSRIRSGKTIGIGTGKARTINMKDAIIDKLRYRDGPTREMDEIFKAQDRQLESTDRQITSDRLELRRSDNIKSCDEFRSEKLGHGYVDLSGAGKYNAATNRRTIIIS